MWRLPLVRDANFSIDIWICVRRPTYKRTDCLRVYCGSKPRCSELHGNLTGVSYKWMEQRLKKAAYYTRRILVPTLKFASGIACMVFGLTMRS